ncbi:chitinase, partial [Streptomyces sp. NPDC094149]
LSLRYANGSTVDRPMNITVNGSVVASGVSFPPTADWNTWATRNVNVTLQAGANTIRATATTLSGGPNLDKLTVGAPSGTQNPMAAAPYEYLGWGNPQKPTDVMAATGVKWFTLAFMLSDGTCNPKWDGSRALTGGSDEAAINSIRGAGGDVLVSFGGWSGNKLGEKCTSASSLAGAYQKVIDAYHLKAIDIDIEDTEFSTATVRQRVVDALKIIKTNNPAIVTYVTMGTTPTGPDATGKDLINRGAAAGLANDGWTIMPFDFGGHSGTMGQASVTALEGLKAAVKSAYGYSDDTAYRHIGVSSMNGTTDEPDEIVTTADFETILSYAQAHHIARFAFWSVNRDRSCTSGSDADSCSGVSQSPYDFTKIVVRYKG